MRFYSLYVLRSIRIKPVLSVESVCEHQCWSCSFLHFYLFNSIFLWIQLLGRACDTLLCSRISQYVWMRAPSSQNQGEGRVHPVLLCTMKNNNSLLTFSVRFEDIFKSHTPYELETLTTPVGRLAQWTINKTNLSFLFCYRLGQWVMSKNVRILPHIRAMSVCPYFPTHLWQSGCQHQCCF